MKKLRYIFELFFWIGGMLCLLIMYSFSSVKQHQQKSKAINIKIKDGDGFIRKKAIYEQLQSTSLYQEDEPLNAYNIQAIEETLTKNPYIYNIEAYFSLSGNITVDIKPRTPICRIVNKYGQHFYIDEKLNKFPVNINHVERVPIVSGYINEVLKQVDTIHTPEIKNAVQLVQYIKKDPFWSLQTGQIVIDDQGDLNIIPNVGNQLLVIGDAENLEQKLKRIKIFYKEGLAKLGWNTYKTINVKFEGQIVCTKR